MMLRSVRMLFALLLVSSLLLGGCRSRTAARQQAKRGAGYGTLTGAVSGFFWGLLRGNPIKGAAEGAFVGGATGAVVGGVHGSFKDRDLKDEFGDVNYKALMALVYRDYPAARELAEQTVNDPNPDYRHASAWISALVAWETRSTDELEACYQKLIETDPDVETREDARVEMRLAERDLQSLRKQFNVR